MAFSARVCRTTAIETSPAWRLPFATMLPWAAAIGVTMSTQFLAQPFVWRNWPVDEVLLGWFAVAGDQLAVALSIGTMLWLAAGVRVRGNSARALLLGAGIGLGAVAGQMVLVTVDSAGMAHNAVAFSTRVLRWVIVGGSVAGLYLLWQRALDAAEAAAASELRRVQLERQSVQARLQSLRSQIEPHFLFNTLATVRRLHDVEPADGARLLGHFVDYLRLAQPALTESRRTLGDELDGVLAYLGVVELRMSGRLVVECDADAALRKAEFPPLILSTLAENAVKHGIGPAPIGGTICISVRRDGDLLEVELADTGVGFAAGATGSGIGLANARARLSTLYGARGQILLRANMPTGLRARVRLPFHVHEARA
jgi:signal transduction histidine kinase